jgi:hypothetical protein
MGLRTFSFGNNKVEAVENARLGLEKMEREVRAAYPYNKAGIGGPVNNTVIAGGIANPSNTITFGNDLDGDYQIASDTATEQIAYTLSGGTLLRNGEPVVEFVQDVDGGNALTFEYRDAAGATTTNEPSIRMVRIKLEVAVDRGIQDDPVTQILTTDVALRNRGEQ